MGLENEEMKRVIIRSNPETFEMAISIAQTTELSNDVSNQDSIHSLNSRGSFTRGRATSYSRGHNSVQRGNGNVYRGSRGFYRGFQSRRYRPGRCYECGSREHYKNECPRLIGIRSVEDQAVGSNHVAELNQLGKSSFNMLTEPPLLVTIKLNGMKFECEVTPVRP